MSFSFQKDSDGLSPAQAAVARAPLVIPPGFGMKTLSRAERDKEWLNVGEEPCPLDLLMVWEAPRRNQLYVVSVDVSSGMQLDYAVIDVTRVGNLREPDEQVAQFRTNTMDETDLAYVADAVGRLYKGKDTQDAVIADECNAMGMATQLELIKHIGYTNLYIWQHWDEVGDQQTNKYGWYTTPRTRPLIIQNYVRSVKTVDPHTGYPDYRVNSPATLEEMSLFHSPGPLWEACAAEGGHDDCIMAGAIGCIVAKQIHGNFGETFADQRRRNSEEVSRAEEKEKVFELAIQPQNTDQTYDQMMGRDDWDSMDADSDERSYLYVEGKRGDV